MSQLRVNDIVGANGSDPVGFSTGMTGRTSGTTPAAGEIGQELTASITSDLSTSSFAQGAYQDVTGLSINLTAGVWQCYATLPFRWDAGTVSGNVQGAYIAVRQSTTVINVMGTAVLCTGTNDSGHLNVISSPISISSTTAYKISITSETLGGTADSSNKTMRIWASADYPATFYAIRIA